MIEEQNFDQEIAEGAVLVDFYADWCGPCKMLTPVLEKVAEEVQGQVKIIKIDIDKAQGIAGRFQISAIPTLILFKNGQEANRLTGLRDADGIKDFLNS